MNSDSSRARRKPAADLADKAAARHALPAHQSRSRATRARILEAAEAVFAENGYDGARLADIAGRAKCSVGAVYFRFEDKSALFLAIAETFADEARASLKDVFEGAEPLDRDVALHRFVVATARNFRRHKGLFRAVVERGLDHPEAMRTIFKLRAELAATIEAILKPAARDKRGLALRVRVMTQMVYGFLLAGVLNPHAPTAISDSRAVAELARACTAYLEEGPP